MEINILNLRSCHSCGVVLDNHQLKFPKDLYLKDGKIDCTKAAWNDYDWKPFIRCPVCNEALFEV